MKYSPLRSNSTGKVIILQFKASTGSREGELLQLRHLHSPQANEHSSPCFQQEHRCDRQSVLHLHLMMFKRASGAGGRSVVQGSSLPDDKRHPHCSGRRSLLLSIQYCTWRYTLRLWYLAADELGGREHTWTGPILVDNFSQKRMYRRMSNVSSALPPYRETRAFSPAVIMSAAFGPLAQKVSAAILKLASLLSFFKDWLLPTPNSLEVVSHPFTA